MIRARQGHSITIDEHSLLTEIKSPADVDSPYMYHGTSLDRYKLISADGFLSRMQRQHIHFLGDLNRLNALKNPRQQEVVICISVERLLESRVQLWKSGNNILLTEGFEGRIPVSIFHSVIINTATEFTESEQ